MGSNVSKRQIIIYSLHDKPIFRYIISFRTFWSTHFTYKSSRKAAVAAQMQSDIKDNLEKGTCCATNKAGKSRTKADSSADVYLMLKELLDGRVFQFEIGRSYEGFKNFRDVYERVNLPDIHKWISKQKSRASFEMF